MGKHKFSIFDYMSHGGIINYFSRAYADALYTFRDFTTPQFSISMAHTHNKLMISKVKYEICKNTISTSSEMNLTKNISDKSKNKG